MWARQPAGTSGLAEVGTLQACLMGIREAKIVKLLHYRHAERALADLGLEG